MDSSTTLARKIRCSIKHEQGRNKNLLQDGQGNLEGAQVVFDRDIPFYTIPKKSGFIRYLGNFPLDGNRKDMPRRRITAFRNPDLILLLTPDGWFSVGTRVDLFTLEDYKRQHQEFLRDMGRYGFVPEGDKIVSICPKLITP